VTRPVQALAVREVVTVVRSRASLALVFAVAGVVAGVVLTSNSQRAFLPVAVDLLLPLELLVPAAAVALGYGPIAGDARREELDVFDTYPVSPAQYVLGVYAGRALALAAVLAVPLAAVGVWVGFAPAADFSFLTTQSGVDSPVIFIRFVALTLVFGLAVLAMALAVSALSRARRSALVLGIALLAVVVVGLDLLVLRGFVRGLVPADQLARVLALSPTSAYRGLVFETVLSTATESDLRQVSPPLAVVGLVGWTAGSLAVTTLAVRRG
jgi:ABC-2 type transport system permease protein